MVEKNKSKNIYEESIIGLKEYIRETREIPNGQKWNAYAMKFGYLSSKSIGFFSPCGFNKLCRNLIKEVNKEEGRARSKEK